MNKSTRHWLFDRMADRREQEAIVGRNFSATYGDLLDGMARWSKVLDEAGIGPGRTVALDGDCNDSTVALLLALIERRAIAVPLASAAEDQKHGFMEMSAVELLIDCRQGEPIVTRRTIGPRHELIERLAAEGSPGLVLFSSGSTGKPKAMLHDLGKLLRKFETPRPAGSILSFLLLDHIGGVNTLLHGLAQGGGVITIDDRRPAAVCAAIERHRAEILPTTPTFLNLLLLSGEHSRHDLSSLRLITYGTEPMPPSTLARLREAFPDTRLQQTYGLSEVGILRSKGREDGSLWIKVGGEGYETKIVDGVLWIRAESAMLGYLNAPSPFDADGWFNTQDAVEQDGEWIRFLGRTSEIINVGGLKVYPAEVEGVLLEMEGVADATVRGERNPLVGQCVVARVNLERPETPADFKSRMRRHCQGRLEPFKVPARVEITDVPQHGVRQKRMR
jgi:acyl-CoA synthetase (AMP-forming)/AMP-acid ligase II